MKYAVISDIHGNMTAFSAVLADAQKQGVDGYLLIGDYYNDFPFPNEVVRRIRSLENAYVIKGNKEGYLRNLSILNQPKWLVDQFAGLCWNFRTIESEHAEYLLNLPEERVISHEKIQPVHIFHSSNHLFKTANLRHLSSWHFALMMKEAPFTRDEYLKYAHDHLHADNELKSILDTLPDGVYIFGHTHVQWHVNISGKLLINAGSCGASLDFDSRAAYSVIETSEDRWVMQERRVPYDLEKTIRLLKTSSLYREAKVWSDITIKQVQTGEDHISFFLDSLDKLAKEKNEQTNPSSNETWNEAAERWYKETGTTVE